MFPSWRRRLGSDGEGSYYICFRRNGDAQARCFRQVAQPQERLGANQRDEQAARTRGGVAQEEKGQALRIGQRLIPA